MAEPGALPEALLAHVTGQRWFASKARVPTNLRVVDSAVPAAGLAVSLVEVGYGPGTHETYQLVLGGAGAPRDALADPALAAELVRLIREGGAVAGAEGTLEFRPAGEIGEPGPGRPVGTEQSNSSVVFGEELILKVFRRLEPGVNPELELLRFLGERGFPHVAPLLGSYQYTGRPVEATLGVLQRFVAGGADGFELALDELGSDPDRFLGRLRRLGEVTGALHSALASDAADPGFCPEEPSAESLALLTADVDEQIERLFSELPPLDALAPIAGRGEDVRALLGQLTHVGAAGKVIRCHGDLHLQQTLCAGDDWVLIDFEGEPARPLHERRHKRSPLRDVAGMLRSFAYAASASALLRGVEAPEGWEESARGEFLAGYLETVEPTLLPPGQAGIERLLSVFELEKAVYELRYELNNRPDWVPIPVAGIVRLLDAP
jgi:trehalose synthase-fused probable maltokinase